MFHLILTKSYDFPYNIIAVIVINDLIVLAEPGGTV